jgi:hypothetical protein
MQKRTMVFMFFFTFMYCLGLSFAVCVFVSFFSVPVYYLKGVSKLCFFCVCVRMLDTNWELHFRLDIFFGPVDTCKCEDTCTYLTCNSSSTLLLSHN